MKLFFCIFIPVILLLSCNRKNTLKRSVTTDYKEVFYGYKLKKYNDSVFQLFSKDISVGFNIPALEKSPALKEIRVYCVGLFTHRFFRQQFFSNDSLISEIYMCYMKNSNDSSYFLIKDHIVLSGKYYDNIPLPERGFPNGIMKLLNQNYDADGPEEYFVEVNEGGNVKSAFVQEDSCENCEGSEKFAYLLLQQIEKTYTFKFNNKFEKITATFGSKLLNVK